MATRTAPAEDLDARQGLDLPWAVVVWNDDVNTFEHVIRAFVEILGHSTTRAEQLAQRIDRDGKAVVAVRPKEEAATLVEAFHRRRIQATMERA